MSDTKKNLNEKNKNGDPAPSHSDTSKSDTQESTIPKRILVVEDTPIQAKKLIFYLSRWGYHTSWVDNGLKALQAIEEDQIGFDLVISDVQMPEMDGITFLGEVRKFKRPEELPIVITTTLKDNDTITKAISLEADDFIVKPYNLSELQLRLKNVLEKNKAFLLVKSQAKAMDIAGDGIAILDAHGHYTYTNDAHVQEFGYYSSRELIGKKWFSLYPEESLNKINKEILPEVDKKGFWKGKITAFRSNGTVYPQELNITGLEGDGYTFICRDITAEENYRINLEKINKKLTLAEQEAQKASELKSKFLANMSHEIRTPLNGILGIADILLDTKLEKNQKELVDIFKSSGNHLLRIVNDILDLSKIEADCLELEFYEFSPDDIRKKIEFMRELCKGKNLEYSFETNVPDNLILKGDITRVMQILTNIANNALKFTEEGSIQISYDLETQFGEGNLEQNLFSTRELNFVFSVKDTGPGIAKEDQQKVFQVFQQADNSVARKFGGTGLGLSICTRLSELMGGKIWLESELGKGSTFFFRIPLEVIGVEGKRLNPTEKTKPEVKADEPSPANETFDYSNFKVLVAEDNKVNQLVVKKVLQKAGFEHITITNDGKEAIDAFEVGNFDIVLMDIHMPNVDGLEATREIRKFEEQKGETQKTPIIGLSASAFAEDISQALEAGCNRYIAKPIDRILLIDCLKESLLKKKSA